MLLKTPQILVVLSCLWLLVGCGNLPKPFAHEGAAKNNPLIALAGGGAIRVRVAPSLPSSLAKPMRESMIKSLWAGDVPASAATNFRPRYLLDGQLKVSYPSLSEPEQVEIIWTLSNIAGEKLDVLDQRLSGARAGWLFLDKELLSDLVAAMGQDVVRRLYARRPSAQVQTQKMSPTASAGDSAIRQQKPIVFLAKIIGAPGDGNKSLYRNLHHFLGIAGADVIKERQKSAFLVKGFVNVSPPFNGSNDVAITWLVTTKAGKELGKVTQNNKVPVGSLRGRWGDIAHVIAQGGSIGIIDIIEREWVPVATEKRLIRR